MQIKYLPIKAIKYFWFDCFNWNNIAEPSKTMTKNKKGAISRQALGWKNHLIKPALRVPFIIQNK
jgi:hypothetical protein